MERDCLPHWKCPRSESDVRFVIFLACEVGGSKFIENSREQVQINIARSNVRMYENVFPWLQVLAVAPPSSSASLSMPCHAMPCRPWRLRGRRSRSRLSLLPHIFTARCGRGLRAMAVLVCLGITAMPYVAPFLQHANPPPAELAGTPAHARTGLFVAHRAAEVVPWLAQVHAGSGCALGCAWARC